MNDTMAIHDYTKEEDVWKTILTKLLQYLLRQHSIFCIYIDCKAEEFLLICVPV